MRASRLPRAALCSAIAAFAGLTTAFGFGCNDASAPPVVEGDASNNCGLSVTPNSEFCASQAVTPDCSMAIGSTETVCGVPLEAPGVPLARATNLSEFSGSGPPQLTCLEVGHYPVASTSKTATASGRARIFSHGCQSNSLTIEFFKVIRDGSANEGNIGDVVGTATTTEADCTADGTVVASADCGTRYECPYTYEGLPTETEMIVRTQGGQWQPLYDYNIYIADSEVDAKGVWQHDVRALQTSDYTLIPSAAYGQPVRNGYGVLAGEVHDCGDVRLQGAVVNIDQSNAALVYFTGAEDAPNPDTTATSTNDLGLYAAFDIPPGTVTVAAAGTNDGAQTTLGFLKARIYPNAVTAVTFRGVLPFQLTSP